MLVFRGVRFPTPDEKSVTHLKKQKNTSWNSETKDSPICQSCFYPGVPRNPLSNCCAAMAWFSPGEHGWILSLDLIHKLLLKLGGLWTFCRIGLFLPGQSTFFVEREEPPSLHACAATSGTAWDWQRRSSRKTGYHQFIFGISPIACLFNFLLC